jgi:uncharacterized protein YcfL
MNAVLRAACLLAAIAVTPLAQSQSAPSGVASKLMLRGDAEGVKVAEMRLARRSDVLVVEADIENTDTRNRQVFYRFRWLDDGGMQVGDGEPWKQLVVYGKEVKVVKGIAPHSKGVDFRLEMNVEK